MEKKKYLKTQLTYTIGYVLSALLTLGVFHIAVTKTWDTATIAIIALAAAALQLIVQSRFFLHLKHKGDSKWKLASYVFTWIMLLIVVLGSLWVMINLNYNMHMTPEQMLQKIQKENTKGF